MGGLLPERIVLQASVSDWKQAISQGAEMLIKDGVITPDYLAAIFDSFAQNGSYMIVMPGVVLAHARPGFGALGNGMSVLTLREPVLYDDDPNNPISVIITFAAVNADEHIDLIQRLAKVLIDDAALNQLKNSANTAEVMQILGDLQ